MKKRFAVLRVIGTIWKVLAWIELILGLISSVLILLVGIFGGGILRRFAEQYGGMPLDARVFGLTGGIVGFIASLVATIIYFLMIYAVGELIYLLLAIEENTRLTTERVQGAQQQAAPPPPVPAYSPPPPSPYTPPPPPPPLPSGPESGSTQKM